MAAEKVRVTVRASGAHPDLLTVQDAMQQVFDIFSLLERDEDVESLAWRLSFATANSPFTAEGEATSKAPGVDVSMLARSEADEFQQSWLDLVAGRPPSPWLGTAKAEIATRVLRRNQNGIGRTDIDLPSRNTTIALTPRVATDRIPLLQNARVPVPEIFKSVGHKEHGSIEGKIERVGTYYGQPAIRVIERKTGRLIWCKVSKRVEEQIAQQANYLDVWEGHRVNVRGMVEYDNVGQLTNVYVTGITRVEGRQIDASALRDPEFTDGMSAKEYLDKFREGELG